MKREPKNTSYIKHKTARSTGQVQQSSRKSSAGQQTGKVDNAEKQTVSRSEKADNQPARRPAAEQNQPARSPDSTVRRSASQTKTAGTTRRSHKALIPIIIGIVVVAIAIFIVIFLNKRNYPVNTSAYGISEEARQEAASNPDVFNVVFLGIDHEEDRSDVMMVVSVNKKQQTVNVISLLRDTRVEIEGHAPTKLGYAYKWGGTDLALNVINTNFNTAFDRYICMTFEDLIDIVDAIGGVDIQLTAEEAYLVNDLAKETYYMEEDAVEGWNTLNGSQALGYARIRKIDSEYARAGRQQVVIKAIISKIKSMSVFRYPAVVSKILGSLKTNLSYGELLSVALIGLKSGGMIQHTIPDANYEEGLFGGWVLNEYDDPLEDPVQWLWIYDLDAASYRLKRIMYDPSYYEDPDLPAAAWIWNELEDVIAGLDIDVSDINLEDEIVYTEPETAAQTDNPNDNENKTDYSSEYYDYTEDAGSGNSGAAAETQADDPSAWEEPAADDTETNETVTYSDSTEEENSAEEDTSVDSGADEAPSEEAEESGEGTD